MKALLLIAASAFLSMGSRDSDNLRELTDSFSGHVHSIMEESRALLVKFQGHNSLYKIAVDHPQFTEIKAKLEKAKKIDQKIKVIAIIPSMLIKEISA